MVATIIAAAAVIFAGFSIFVASAANRRADDANTIADEAKGIAQDALDHQRQYAPAPWGQAELHSEANHRYIYRIANSSGRKILLKSLTAEADTGYEFEYELPADAVIEYGDAVPFRITYYLPLRTAQVRLRWQFADETSGAVEETVRTTSK